MKKFIEMLKVVDKGTLCRSVAMILAALNQIISVVSTTVYSTSAPYLIVSSVITILTAVVNAWENNDWTPFAKIGTGVLNALQDGKITKEEVLALLENKDEKGGA